MENGEYRAICSKKIEKGENGECTISAVFMPNQWNPKIVAPQYNCHEDCNYYECSANTIEGTEEYFELIEYKEK